jgi:hypothetical protein
VIGDAELALRYRALVAELARDGVQLVTKDRVWHQRLLGRLLTWLTLGAQRRYLDAYVTTIGRTIYLTPDWDARGLADRWATLRHERVHVAQFRRFGALPLLVGYLLLPLPVGLAWCRMTLEREAYAETVRALVELGGRAAAERARAHVIAQFTGGSYAWMWPFPRAVGRWFDALVEDLTQASKS